MRDEFDGRRPPFLGKAGIAYPQKMPDEFALRNPDRAGSLSPHSLWAGLTLEVASAYHGMGRHCR